MCDVTNIMFKGMEMAKLLHSCRLEYLFHFFTMLTLLNILEYIYIYMFFKNTPCFLEDKT